MVGGLAGLLVMFVVFETLKNMIAKETQTRLERLLYAILRLARRRAGTLRRRSVWRRAWT
ncbi:hypothetical protein Drose_36785 [Dactylosporangium roseum]|uniref:Uncharacterized protein n=1 Tax=Dactylosporangium roseum TaxID=47989 RepID=A0ABY5Z670_9ACTN|nr:hypothetical protein [Dactylosporangium roseum]UWZ36510.1 hypothetical protein Drose_36785 [Dactylosporangium roseum]